jgi:tetratricopeptide (TPR) repeat protein
MNLGFRMQLDDDEAEALFAEGQALAEQVEHAPREHTVLLFAYSLLQADGQRFLDLGTRARQVAIEANDLVLADECLTGIYGHMVVGNGTRSLALNAEAVSRPSAPDEKRVTAAGTDPYIWALHTRSEFLTYMGRLAEAEGSLEEGMPIVLASDAREVQLWAYGIRAMHDFHCGSARGGVAMARRGVELAEQVGSPLNRTFAMMNLSFGHLALGEYAEALPLLESIVATVESEASGARPWRPVHRGLLAFTLARLGESDRAVEVAEQGIEIAAQYHLAGFAPFSWYGLAVARIRQGREEEALAAINGMAASIEATDIRALAPRVPECRADLARLRGDADGCERHLREALDAYRAMDAHGHVRRIEALLSG